MKRGALPGRGSRGLTLLEILVAIAVMSMVAILIYGSFDGLSRSKSGLGKVNDRFHQGRSTMRRLVEEVSSAFLSMHQPTAAVLVVRRTMFGVKDSTPADRLDMTTFSHQRVVANSRESDQNEISYFGCPDPSATSKLDLCRREASIIDYDPNKGGIINVVAEDIDLFDVKMLDPVSGLWNDSWDTTQAIGQPNRMPVQVRVTLVMHGGDAGQLIKLEEKIPIAMVAPLMFALPQP